MRRTEIGQFGLTSANSLFSHFVNSFTTLGEYLNCDVFFKEPKETYLINMIKLIIRASENIHYITYVTSTTEASCNKQCEELLLLYLLLIS